MIMGTEIAGRTASVSGWAEPHPVLAAPSRAEWSSRQVWPQVLVMFHSPCPFPGAAAALLGCPVGLPSMPLEGQQDRAPGGYRPGSSASPLPEGPGLPLRGDNSGHSSNLELFGPYQLVSAGLPKARSQGGVPSGCFPGQESVQAPQQRRKAAALTGVHSSPRARAPRPRTAPHLSFPKPAILLLSCPRHLRVWPSPHTSLPGPLHEPFPLSSSLSTKQRLRALAQEPNHLGSRPRSSTCWLCQAGVFTLSSSVSPSGGSEEEGNSSN